MAICRAATCSSSAAPMTESSTAATLAADIDGRSSIARFKAGESPPSRSSASGETPAVPSTAASRSGRARPLRATSAARPAPHRITPVVGVGGGGAPPRAPARAAPARATLAPQARQRRPLSLSRPRPRDSRHKILTRSRGDLVTPLLPAPLLLSVHKCSSVWASGGTPTHDLVWRPLLYRWLQPPCRAAK